MAFAFGKLASFLLLPSNLLVILGIIGGLGLWRGPRTWARLLLGGAFTLMLVVTLLPVGAWLTAALENRFPPPTTYPPRIDGAVVLGGGVLAEATAARGTPAISDTGERYLALLELARRYPTARIVFTGGVGRLGGGAPPEADTVRLLLERHGLGGGRVLLEDRARSTRENALHARAMAQPRPGEVWLLVTSAAHMPRAIGSFRGVGWEIESWPVDYRTTGRFELELRPRLVDRLRELDDAAHEWLGLVYYRVLGWTPAVFPSPQPPPPAGTRAHLGGCREQAR